MIEHAETIEEYYIRKAARVMLDIFMIGLVNLWVLGSMLLESSHPDESTILTVMSAAGLLAVLATRTDTGRKLLNRIPGKDYTILRRPDEVTTEVPADD